MIAFRRAVIVITGSLIAGASNSLAAQVATTLTQPQATQMPPARAELERRFRERTAQVVRRRLELNDDQMSKLQASNRQFDQQRMSLVAEERQTRQALRAELMAGNAANQQKVGSLLDQLLRLQRRRLDIVESEQRDLSGFLTPVQRAKYFGLQNEMRKRMLELRDRAPGGAVGGAGMRPLRNPLIRRNGR
jgi:Spy/CpxP family protein refolding chaperone